MEVIVIQLPKRDVSFGVQRTSVEDQTGPCSKYIIGHVICGTKSFDTCLSRAMNLARSTRKKADFQRLNYCNFNGTQECFVIATDSGFSVFNVDPFRERVERVLGGGLGIVEMLNSTNYLALVGGGRNPKWSDNKVVIWDDTKQKSVMELDFTSSVRAVRLRRDRIIVVLENKVIVYSFASPPEKLHTFETCDNELGLCALAPLENNVLAFPGRTEGFIQIAYLSNSSHLSPDQPTRMTRASPNISIIHAHAGSLSCLNISQDGKLVASASAVVTFKLHMNKY